MNLFFLIIGSFLTILFLIFLFKGSKYDYMLESLSGDAFPAKTIYSVGLAWQDLKIGKLRGALGEQLRSDSSLMYSKNYSEFYARIIWAQILSFGHLFISVFFVAAGFANGAMVLFLVVVGLFFCILSSYYFYTYTKEKISRRRDDCEREFPNAISKLALIVNSGVILHDAWDIVAMGNEGVLYDLMSKSCEQMRNGTSEIDALHDFGVKTNSDDIKKFTAALIQSIERGGGDLPQFLVNQSAEIWTSRRQVMLQKGEKAAGALLMPIALMFLGIMLIVISAAMQSFNI